MESAAELPKSSQPPLGAFIELYEELTADGSEVISIHLSSELSGTYQTAVSASNMVGGNITVIDSMYISKGLGFQVVRAALLAEEGMTAEAIVKDLENLRDRTSLYVTIDHFDNLIKGGRIGRGKRCSAHCSRLSRSRGLRTESIRLKKMSGAAVSLSVI